MYVRTGRSEVGPGLPGRLTFAPLCSSILEPDLDTRLAQLELAGELLPREHVRVRGALKRALQLLQLIGREGGPGLLLFRSLRLLAFLLFARAYDFRIISVDAK